MLQRKTSVAAAIKAVSKVGAWVAAGVLLAACGQKGPLTLPAPAAASAPASTAGR